MKAQFANRLRQNMTAAESHLWARLSQMPGWVAQRVLGSYIVDFAHCGRRLAIEVDGTAHVGREAYDSERDAVLARGGWRVVRFSNESVLAEREAVIAAINRALSLRMLPCYGDGLERQLPRIGDAVRFGCAVRRWKRLHPPVEVSARLVRK